MRLLVLALAGLLAFGAAAPNPVLAQASGAETTAPARKATPRAARPKREPSAGQLAARERQRKCGQEWREAKAKGTTGGRKWPQYYSACNARMKGGQA